MILMTIYVVIVVIMCFICMNIKKGLRKSMYIGVPIIGIVFLSNVAFRTMPNFHKLVTEKDVYKIESVNTDTIVYIDEDGNYSVAGKDEVMLIKGAKVKLSLLAKTKYTKVGRVLIIQDLPEDLTAYIVSKDAVQ